LNCRKLSCAAGIRKSGAGAGRLNQERLPTKQSEKDVDVSGGATKRCISQQRGPFGQNILRTGRLRAFNNKGDSYNFYGLGSRVGDRKKVLVGTPSQRVELEITGGRRKTSGPRAEK